MTYVPNATKIVIHTRKSWYYNRYFYL